MENKQMTLVYRIILIVLLGVFTIVSLFTVATVDVDMSSAVASNSNLNIISEEMDIPNEVTLHIGFFPMVKFAAPLILNASDVGTFFGGVFSDGLPDEGFWQATERIFQDEQCAESMLKLYSGLCLVSDCVVEYDDDCGISTAKLLMNIVSGLSLFMLLFAVVICPIYILVKYISFLVKPWKKIKDESDRLFELRIDEISFLSNSAISFLALYLLSSVCFRGFQMGIAIWGALILYTLICLLRCARLVLFTSENRKIVLIKQTISIVTIVAAIILLLNFSGLDIIHTFQDKIEDMTLFHCAGIAEETGSLSSVEDIATTTNIVYAIVISTFICLGITTLVAVMHNGIERTVGMKSKRGGFISRRSMIKSAVCILVIAMVPLFISVNSEEELEEAYEAGHFKIWYTEYKEEGTIDNRNYQVFTEYIEEGNEEIEKLKEALKIADGEKADELSYQIKQAESDVQAARRQLREIENKSARISISLIAAIMLLLSEIAYAVVLKKSDSKKKEILIENQ